MFKVVCCRLVVFGKELTGVTLGVSLSYNGKYYNTQKRLSEQASKALFSLHSLFEQISLNVAEKANMFDSMILPILMYATEVWGFHKGNEVEKIHLTFLKQILSVRQQTSNITLYGELGRYPLVILRNIYIIKYWS